MAVLTFTDLEQSVMIIESRKHVQSTVLLSKLLYMHRDHAALCTAKSIFGKLLPALGGAEVWLLHADGQAPQHLGGAQDEEHIWGELLDAQLLDGTFRVERINPAPGVNCCYGTNQWSQIFCGRCCVLSQ